MNYSSEQYKYLDQLYRFYNDELFDGCLPDILFTLSRVSKASGFFASNRWKDKNGSYIHEISINPDYIKEQLDVEFHQTMVHEMCHLWQMEYGKPGRKGYHNKQWAEKMISVGLMPTDTGKEGGKKTGQNISDYIIEGGAFQLFFKKLQENNMNPLPLEPNNSHLYCKETSADGSVKFLPISKEDKHQTKTGKRLKYSCSCGRNIWGKKDLEIYCKNCNTDFLVQKKYEY